MHVPKSPKIYHINDVLKQTSNQFELDVLTGLSKKVKAISSKYFYDEEGSELFKKITELQEYYPTRCETEIIEKFKDELLEYLKGEAFNFVEFGSGDGRKTKILLSHFLQHGADFEYFPLDISQSALEEQLAQLHKEIPGLKATGLSGEYFDGLKKLNELNEKPNLVLFLGSNIGNFNPEETRKFMLSLWESLSNQDLVLVGFDLVKDIHVLQKAYDDSRGITAQFNLNLLKRINRDLHADFDLSNFKHYSYYEPQRQVMKSYLVSLKDQVVTINKLKKKFHFKYMEALFTENSHKYSLEKIKRIAREANFEILESFTDSKGYFIDVLLKCVK